MRFLIQRLHLRPGKWLNSPLRKEWRFVGAFNADNNGHALFLAVGATGADPDTELRVVGIQAAPEFEE